MTGYTVTRIASLDRLPSSVNGNPRYRVHFENGESAITSSDAAFCYGITNPEMRGRVVVQFTRAGRIADIRPACSGCERCAEVTA